MNTSLSDFKKVGCLFLVVFCSFGNAHASNFSVLHSASELVASSRSGGFGSMMTPSEFLSGFSEEIPGNTVSGLAPHLAGVTSAYIFNMVNAGCVSFNGTKSNASVGLRGALGDMEDLFTIEFWIKSDQTESSGVVLDGQPQYENGLRFSNSNENGSQPGDRLLFALNADPATHLVSNTPVFDGNWHHIAASYNASEQRMRLYVDGLPDAEIQLVSGSSSLNLFSRINLGYSSQDDGTQHLAMEIGFLRLWKSERSVEDIRAAMFSNAIPSDNPDLRFEYPFEQFFDAGGGSYQSGTTGGGVGAMFMTNVSLSPTGPPKGTWIIGEEGWRLIGSPMETHTIGTVLSGIWTQGFEGANASGGQPNVMYWNEPASSFEPISSLHQPFPLGAGLIAYIFENDEPEVPGSFPKVIQVPDIVTTSFFLNASVSYTESGDLASDGWNLVGNPYRNAIDWDWSGGWFRTGIDNAFYVWNAESGQYQSWNGHGGTTQLERGYIEPWQAFWVKAHGNNPVLHIYPISRVREGYVEPMLKPVEAARVQFRVESGAHSSETVIMQLAEAEIGKDVFDTWKLYPLANAYLSLFTRLETGHGLDINAIPVDLHEPLEVPMGLTARNVSGRAVVSWEGASLSDGFHYGLMDLLTGEKFDLKIPGSIEIHIAGNKTTNEPTGLSIPSHRVMSPEVQKTAEGDRFIIRVEPVPLSLNNPPEKPEKVALEQNYPNPFNPTTVIRYTTPENGHLSLKVYDLLGREIAVLVNGNVSAGTHEASFDASSLPSGMYVYRLESGGMTLTRKMTMLK